MFLSLVEAGAWIPGGYQVPLHAAVFVPGGASLFPTDTARPPAALLQVWLFGSSSHILSSFVDPADSESLSFAVGGVPREEEPQNAGRRCSRQQSFRAACEHLGHSCAAVFSTLL